MVASAAAFISFSMLIVLPRSRFSARRRATRSAAHIERPLSYRRGDKLACRYSRNAEYLDARHSLALPDTNNALSALADGYLYILRGLMRAGFGGIKI